MEGYFADVGEWTYIIVGALYNLQTLILDAVVVRILSMPVMRSLTLSHHSSDLQSIRHMAEVVCRCFAGIGMVWATRRVDCILRYVYFV